MTIDPERVKDVAGKLMEGGSPLLAFHGLGERWRSVQSRKRQPFFALHLIAPELCEMRTMQGYPGFRQYRLTPFGLAIRNYLQGTTP